MYDPPLATTRFVANNTNVMGILGARLPQTPQAIPRQGVPITKEWGDLVTRTVTSLHAINKLEPLRVIHHPGMNQSVVYPKNPDRTLNYHRAPVRKWNVTHAATLQGAVNSIDPQRWEDVAITEVWNGEGARVSIPISFIQTLHLFRITAPPLGTAIGWQPFDLSELRHVIQPVSLTIGGRDFDLNEVRDDAGSGDALANYGDRTVAWTFTLVKPPVFAPSLIVSEGV